MRVKVKMQVSAMLFALILMGSAIVSVASALDDKELLEENYVSAEVALKNSERVFNNFVSSGAYSVDNMSGKYALIRTPS